MKKIAAALLLVLSCLTTLAQQKKIDSLLVKLTPGQNPNQLETVAAQIAELPGGISSMIKYANGRLIQARKLGDAKAEETYLLVLTSCHIQNQDFSSALENCLEGLKVSESLHDKYFMSRFFWHAGTSCVYEKQTVNGITYFRESLKAAAGTDTVIRVTLYSNLETSYVVIKKPDSARFFAELEYKLAKMLKDSPGKNRSLFMAMSDLGEVQNALNHPDSALALYRRALDLQHRYHVQTDDGFLEKNVASSFLRTGKPDSAEKYALISYQMAAGKKIYEWAAEDAGILSKVYEGKDYKKSLFYYKAQIAARDSLNEGEVTKRFVEVTAAQKKQREEFDKAAAAYQQKVRFYSVVGISSVVALIAFILFVAYRKQQNANRQLKDQKTQVEEALEKLKLTQTQLIQSEKMASLGELTAGIAHEIQNPLNFVNNFSDVNREMLEELKAESEKPRTERDEQLETELIDDLIENEQKINHHGKRAGAIVKGMLQHSRSASGQKEPTDLNTLADEYLRLAYHGLRAKDKEFNAELITHFDEKLAKVNVIPQDIGRVLLNVINNAFYATQQKLKIAGVDYKPTVEVSTAQQNDSIMISVKDNGTGIPENIREKIMQPFFTTKPTGEGTGLGLSLSYDIIAKGHGGSIDVNSTEGAGSEFIISLPY